MKLSSEQEIVCKVFCKKRNGIVHCSECPMALSKTGFVCLRNVKEDDAKEYWDWDGSPYPALEKGGEQNEAD